MADYGTQVQSLVLAVLLATAAVPPASFSADATPPGGDGATFHLAQGGECYEVAAYGDGNTTVEDFYDYRRPSTEPPSYKYSSHGTRHLQENQVSNVFVYHGTDGYSLVMLHDELDDAPYGSTVTFEISGLPVDREWVVEDDAYEGRDDEFSHGPTSSTIHWKWSHNRTDGAAVRGLGGDAYEAVTIDPAFNEDAARWGDWVHSEGNHRVHEWRLLGADGTAVSLDMDRPASIASGGCEDDGTTTTTTTTETSTTTQTTETTQTTTTSQTTQTTTETTQTTTETTSTTETTQTTTETTQTTTTTTTDEDDSNDGDGSSSQPFQDEDPGSSQSGGGQPPADEEPSRATADLTDADGRFGNVTLEADADAAPAVETDGSPPADVRAPAAERDGFAALSYLDVETDGATATVTLSTDRLEAASADADGVAAAPDEVSLFRFENGSWTAVETERVDPLDGNEASNETVGFRADVTDGTYAVGVERPAIGVADLTVTGANPSVGESVEVVATVENRGRADGTRTVTIAVGGETVATRNVSVPAGETHEVIVTHAFEAAGVHDVEVGDEFASVTVEGIETTETATATTEDDASTSDTTFSTVDATSDSESDAESPGVPGFGVGVALAALAGAVLIVLRRG